MSERDTESFNSTFIQEAGDLWQRATHSPFLDGVRKGTLPKEAFNRWLIQDYHFVSAFLRFVAALLARSERAAQPLLVQGVSALDDELAWYLRPAVLKTGALGSATVVTTVARKLSSTGIPLVVDPVLVSKHGDALADDEVRRALTQELLPCALLVTPNKHEASALSGFKVFNTETALESARVIARTGCTFSAAITAELAKGSGLKDALIRAKAYVFAALKSAAGLGSGIGPLDHDASPGGAQTVRTETLASS